MDNTSVNRFYEENVKMSRDETRQNLDIVIPLVYDILKYVHDRDPRFKIQPLNVGSYYSNLKVSRADEFDFSVVLDTPTLVWGSGTPAYYGFNENNQVVEMSVPLPSPPVGKCFISLGNEWNAHERNEGQSCLTVGKHVIPIKVKRWFKQLISEAVNRPQIRQYVDAKKLSESPAATLSITHPKMAGDCISIDLAPMIEGRVPFKPEFGWPRQKSWPSRQKIDKIKELGINHVAKDPFYWMSSFATCEKELLNEIDINGTCRKKTQRIMKKLRELWCPRHLKQELTSYHLKNILFWECENHPSDYEWTNDHLATRIESMCYLLIQHIQRGKLPLYFHTGVNLFETKDKEVLRQVAQNILNFVRQPSAYLEITMSA